MKRYYEIVQQNKKLSKIVFWGFSVFLGCFAFPIFNFTHSELTSLKILSIAINLFGYYEIGSLGALLYDGYSKLDMVNTSLVYVCLGMAARFLLEFGEVSNTYNFTLPNIVFHMAFVVLLSLGSWALTKKQLKKAQ